MKARLIGLKQRLSTKDEEITTGQKTAQALPKPLTLRTKHQNMLRSSAPRSHGQAAKAKEALYRPYARLVKSLLPAETFPSTQLQTASRDVPMLPMLNSNRYSAR